MAHSTGAARDVLSSFLSLRRDDETRRRDIKVMRVTVAGALQTVDIQRQAQESNPGSGHYHRSLMAQSPDPGVSYKHVEQDAVPCEIMSYRRSVRKVCLDPREILSNIKSIEIRPSDIHHNGLRHRRRNIRDVVFDEQPMSSMKEEILCATTMFSARLVVCDLDNICSYRSISVLGCIYPFHGVCIVRSLCGN